MTCPACGETLDEGAAFCESCGTPVGTPATAPAAVEPVAEQDAPISAPTRLNPVAPPPLADARPCLQCGGAVDADGYCTSCGAKAPSERDHFREEPASWVAGVCDRGIVHDRNEDAMALLGTDPPGSRAVLVVLDGVSSSIDSDVASLAGARATRELLRTPLPRGMGTPESRDAAVTSTLAAAVEAANDAIVATTAADSPSPASATFAVAVVEADQLVVANVGDSRVYWMPDGAPGVQVTVDDSAAEQLIQAGFDRDAAENGPQGHAITRWLGRDAPDLSPRVARVGLDAPGWVLACSDGLWNYASTPEQLGEQVVAATTAGATTPADLALALVEFATRCGGRDNITVALARVDPAGAAPVETGPASVGSTSIEPAPPGQDAPTAPRPEGT